MYTNTLRVTLQHTMDNVVSRYVLTHEACVARKTLLSIDADFSARRSFRTKNRSDL